MFVQNAVSHSLPYDEITLRYIQSFLSNICRDEQIVPPTAKAAQILLDHGVGHFRSGGRVIGLAMTKDWNCVE